MAVKVDRDARDARLRRVRERRTGGQRGDRAARHDEAATRGIRLAEPESEVDVEPNAGHNLLATSEDRIAEWISPQRAR